MRMTLRVWIMLGLAAAVAGCSGDKEDKHTQFQGTAPTSKSAMAPEALIFVPYADADGKITGGDRDKAIASTWQKISAGRQQLSLLELRDALKGVEGGSAGFFSPLEFDPQGEGIVTKDKFAHALDVRFAKLDRNDDGVVERNELGPLPRNENYKGDSKEPDFGGDIQRGGSVIRGAGGGY